MVTSNHVHLLVSGDNDHEVIPQSMQLIAGRTGQEYNQRKNRKGAFWEDRYHATAVESGSHLTQCLVYIDLNMVRAGVVAHQREWPYSGYSGGIGVGPDELIEFLSNYIETDRHLKY